MPEKILVTGAGGFTGSRIKSKTVPIYLNKE